MWNPAILHLFLPLAGKSGEFLQNYSISLISFKILDQVAIIPVDLQDCSPLKTDLVKKRQISSCWKTPVFLRRGGDVPLPTKTWRSERFKSIFPTVRRDPPSKK
ncbi:hypothetical protein ABEX25_24900 [Paenibacillus thiaminolyticus]|uniref:hypothetical protein n=1 Tax=Paenibacillus thiaminolyticus TaxID=49283 RepID=UPI003D2E895E